MRIPHLSCGHALPLRVHDLQKVPAAAAEHVQVRAQRPSRVLGKCFEMRLRLLGCLMPGFLFRYRHHPAQRRCDLQFVHGLFPLSG